MPSQDKVTNTLNNGNDLYRDTPLRYLGYANEIGEAFRPVVPRMFVNLTYAVAISYVVADCGDKTYKKYKSPSLGGSSTKQAAITCGDVFLWQMVASIAVPGLIINRITWGTGKMLQAANIKGMPRKWGATLTGLASIPLIIGPIDHAVDVVMDNTYRKWLGN